MTNLEAIKKITKLPKLKKGYVYNVDSRGKVTIHNKEGIWKGTLYFEFAEVVKNRYLSDIEAYSNLFAKPIIKTVITTETKIVGYE